MKKVYLYKSADGRVPFTKFLDTVDIKMKAKILHGLMRLSMFPEFMTEPHVKYFSIAKYNGLYEYREKIRILVRIIFKLDDNGDIIILHPFVKKRDRNTMNALESSLRMLEDVKSGNAELVELDMGEVKVK